MVIYHRVIRTQDGPKTRYSYVYPPPPRIFAPFLVLVTMFPQNAPMIWPFYVFHDKACHNIRSHKNVGDKACP